MRLDIVTPSSKPVVTGYMILPWFCWLVPTQAKQERTGRTWSSCRITLNTSAAARESIKEAWSRTARHHKYRCARQGEDDSKHRWPLVLEIDWQQVTPTSFGNHVRRCRCSAFHITYWPRVPLTFKHTHFALPVMPPRYKRSRPFRPQSASDQFSFSLLPTTALSASQNLPSYTNPTLDFL